MKSKILQDLAEKGIKSLNEVEARGVLKEYDIACPEEIMVKYGAEKGGKDYLREMKEGGMPEYPVFLKVISRAITSKTDANAIERVSSDEEASKSIDRILKNAKRYDEKAEVQGVLASEDASNETREVFLGAAVDDHFGHMISLGFGGIYVEVYGDVEFRAVPLEESDVHSMINGLRGKEILGDFRGMRAIDMDSLVETTLKFSRLIEENPEIREMDVNPLLAGPGRTVAVDTLIRISP
ncbi:hypothetical protein AKJ44_01715 [candidate division MSBL1 archaeon SCGC-AAA261F17]|uniref:acetate--CoA ligase (ADP-forming) n=1 Tax=candidate division MSBL1 archaeon SCGC-AAA261F17 TaxID=1698274 RepID=A0A133V6F1_9EURY|nr:hypothetical protein AKJ44_01715 [candidate division MSBL1 archaeon SCGC-AAA261F17]